MPETVYFDLETQRSFNDVGGSSNIVKMGVSVACAYSTKTGEYSLYREDELDGLVTLLTKADLVVGHNHVRFDYGVLEAYTVLDLEDQTVNLDMLLDLEKHTGRRLRLDAVASATLGVGKTAVGTDALKWWQQYKASRDPEPLLKIAEYCAYDVKVTKCVYEYGVAHGHVKYADNGGQEQIVPVSWK
jgi:uncharacterized protein YprB with RNaseH-like and TPR domain